MKDSPESSIALAFRGGLFGSDGRFGLKTVLKRFYPLRRHRHLDDLAVVVHPEIQTDGLALRRGSSDGQMIQLGGLAGEFHGFTALEYYGGVYFRLPDHVDRKLLRLLVREAGSHGEQGPGIERQ